MLALSQKKNYCNTTYTLLCHPFIKAERQCCTHFCLGEIVIYVARLVNTLLYRSSWPPNVTSSLTWRNTVPGSHQNHPCVIWQTAVALSERKPIDNSPCHCLASACGPPGYMGTLDVMKTSAPWLELGRSVTINDLENHAVYWELIFCGIQIELQSTLRCLETTSMTSDFQLND